MYIKTFKTYFINIYLLLVLIDVLSAEYGFSLWVKAAKAIIIPLLIFFYFENRKHDCFFLDKAVIFSFFFTYIGLWASYLLRHGESYVILVTLIYLIEGQIQIFIISRLHSEKEFKAKTEFLRIGIILLVVLSYFILVFPSDIEIIYFIYIIRSVQLSVMFYFSSFRKDQHTAIFISVCLIIISNMISGLGHFIGKIPHQYVIVHSTFYLSKFLLAVGFISMFSKKNGGVVS